MPTDRPRIALLAAPETSPSVLYGLYDVLLSVGAVYPDMTTGEPGEALLDVSIVTADGRPFRCFGNILVEPHASIDEVEAAVGAWTRARSRLEVAERLQSLGIEAVPVADFGDIYDDPQVAHRDHFVPLTHAAMGPRMYEHNGFRVSGCAAGYDRAGPLLGQDNDWVQTELLRLTDDERAKLAEDGVFK